MSQTSKGLERLRRERDYQGMLDVIPYTAHLGIAAETGADGPIYTLPSRDNHIGNKRLPAVHGGARKAARNLLFPWGFRCPASFVFSLFPETVAQQPLHCLNLLSTIQSIG